MLLVSRSHCESNLFLALVAGCWLPWLAGCGGSSGLEDVAFAQNRGNANAAAHPLSPLTDAEIRTAVTVIQADRALGPQVRFPCVVLREPPKAAVLAGTPVPREAYVVAYDTAQNITAEFLVNIDLRRVISTRQAASGQPFILGSEVDRAADIAFNDPTIQQSLRLRGYTDREQVQVDLWAPGTVGLDGIPAAARLGRCLFYDISQGSAAYAHPIAGLEAVINLTTGEVLRVRDTGPLPAPGRADRYFSSGAGNARRDDDTRLRISQPNGPNFTLRDDLVRWENWQFRYTNHQREGMVIHLASFLDGDARRSVLYRGSLAEMAVPYGDPDELWTWRAPVDAGEYGLGQNSQTLRTGLDVPDNAVLRDSVFVNEYGQPRTIPRSVAIYERDGGLLWKHVDDDIPGTTGRRARELVVYQLMTVGNYDYGLAWIFTQDGQIKVEVELTGVVLTKGVAAVACERCAALTTATGGVVAAEGADRFGTLVAPRVIAPIHQHFFSFRLDLDVDGPGNTVAELNVLPLSRTDPLSTAAGRNGFFMEETILAQERDSRRDLDFRQQRHWKVFNPNARTALGHAPGYVLIPGENSIAYQAADAPIRQRARFIEHTLSVTQQRDGELYPAGDFASQNPPDQGLPQFLNDDQPLLNADVVLWYTLGVTHLPRAEDWPVMPVHRAGFRLSPNQFFARNPAL